MKAALKDKIEKHLAKIEIEMEKIRQLISKSVTADAPKVQIKAKKKVKNKSKQKK